MRTRRLLPAAGVALALAVGVFAGTAMAGGGGNGATPTAGKSSVQANFKSTTAAQVKAAAVINSDGSVLRASTLPYHVTASSNLATGQYDVRFSHSIGGCAWVGTVGFGTFGGNTGAAEITITGRSGTNNGLFVTTANSAGTLANEPFHVIVIC
jgi:hypothetical protein